MRISDIITNKNMKLWKQGDIITLTAPMGCGKSYFVKNDLYKYSKVNNKKILFLVHRTILNNQFKSEVLQADKADIIQMKTYQSIQNTKSIDLSEFDYIICDEFHHFITDSTFNYFTDISLKKILSQSKAIKIFMSATSSKMKEYLNEKGYNIKEYNIRFKYSFISNLYFYHNNADLDDIVLDFIRNNQKAVFFLQSAELAYTMYTKFKKYSAFICSSYSNRYKNGSSKASDKLRSHIDTTRGFIEKREKFKEQFLWTTAVMDAGVNLNDPDLHNIIIDMQDTDTLIQCVGRKRIQDNSDYINLYIKSMDGRKLNGLINTLAERIEIANEFIKYDKINRQDKFIQKHSRVHYNMIYSSPIENNTSTLELNELMHFKNRKTKEEYQEMYDLGCDSEPNYGYCEYIKKIFQQKHYKVYGDICKNMKIVEYLDFWKDIRLYELDKNKLIEFIDYKFNGRKVKSRKKINQEFMIQRLPYVIEDGRNNSNDLRYWVIRKV